MSDIEPIRCVVVRETSSAYLLKEEGNDGREDWFPKSQVSFKQRNTKTGKAVAEVPLWLLKKKGWDQ